MVPLTVSFRVDEEEYIAKGGTKEECQKYDLNGDGILDTNELEARAADSVAAGTWWTNEIVRRQRAAEKGQVFKWATEKETEEGQLTPPAAEDEPEEADEGFSHFPSHSLIADSFGLFLVCFCGPLVVAFVAVVILVTLGGAFWILRRSCFWVD